MKVHKLNYYKNYFTQNSRNLKKVWKGIKGIINVKQKNDDVPSCFTDKTGKSITNPTKIASVFCDQYSNVAENILNQRKFAGDGNFERFLPSKNQNSLSDFQPIRVKEAASIIQQIDPKKAVGPSSIPTTLN